tara:strand:- start:360 stop:719 length:360 start_codon:yes stop_codon:yes gene_type:complete
MTRERAKELLPVITAFAEGKDIEIRIDDHWHLVVETTWGRDADYRIKPSPVLRPWRPEEVPVGAVVTRKSTPLQRRIIMGIEMDGNPMLGGYGNIHSSALLENWILADGKPCGVMEGSV